MNKKKILECLNNVDGLIGCSAQISLETLEEAIDYLQDAVAEIAECERTPDRRLFEPAWRTKEKED